MFLSVFFRVAISFVCVVLAVWCILKLKEKNNCKFASSSIIIVLILFIVPYMVLFYGSYKKNNLNLPENVNEVVSLIEKLDISYDTESYTVEFYGEKFTIESNVEGGEDIFPGYSFIGAFEAEANNVYMKIDVLQGDAPIDENTFISRALVAELTQYNDRKFSSKIESGKNEDFLWISSPEIVQKSPDFKINTGAYNGYFCISSDNKIYCCSYSYLSNMKLTKMTAEDLIGGFIDVENMYGTSEML